MGSPEGFSHTRRHFGFGRRGPIAQRAMRPHLVVLPPSAFDHHPCLQQRLEAFSGITTATQLEFLIQFSKNAGEKLRPDVRQKAVLGRSTCFLKHQLHSKSTNNLNSAPTLTCVIVFVRDGRV